MKKKLVVLIVAICMALGGVAIAEDTLAITATFYPLYVAAVNVTRDVPGIELSCMAPPSAGCLHDYQMTTADRRLLADSDVLIYNGAGLEAFLDKLLPTLSAALIEASAGIALLPGDHEEVNPHVWVSLEGMQAETRNIAAGLSAVDEANASAYAANAEAYCERLEALRAEMKTALLPCAGTKIVTFHEAFDYFAAEFDLDVVASVITEHESAPPSRRMAELADMIRKEDVKALFAEPQYEDISVDILAKETGVPVYLLDPAVSGEPDATDTDAYLRIMQGNLAVLLEAFS